MIAKLIPQHHHSGHRPLFLLCRMLLAVLCSTACLHADEQGGRARNKRLFIVPPPWFNNSPTANIIDDIPNESRLEPVQWGNALLE